MRCEVHLKTFWRLCQSTNPRCHALRSRIQAHRQSVVFVLLVSPQHTEERLQDGGDSACGLWLAVVLLLGFLCRFLHICISLPSTMTWAHAHTASVLVEKRVVLQERIFLRHDQYTDPLGQGSDLCLSIPMSGTCIVTRFLPLCAAAGHW